MEQKTRQYYQDRLKKVEAGLSAIKSKIASAPTESDRLDLALAYKDEIKILQREYRITRSAIDILYFAYEYFSVELNPNNSDNLIPKGVFIDEAPDFHHELCSKLEELTWENVTKKIGWSVPRGHGKSMFLSNIYPIHSILFKGMIEGGRKYILIVSETEAMAQRFVEYVGNQLKFNEKLIEDFGVFLHPDKMKNEQDNLEGFITTSGVKVQSASMGKQLRGARHLAFRPDLIILDDMESAKNTNTKELRDKNLHWYNSVIVPIGTPERTAIIYMGTLIHGSGLLPNVLNRADYDSRIYSAIIGSPERPDLWEKFEHMLLQNDNPNRLQEADLFYFENQEEMDKGVSTLWSRFTYADLIKKKIEIGSRAFASEYLNKPSDNESMIFRPDEFAYFEDKDLFDRFNRPLNLEVFAFWDIALGKNKRSDYNAIVTIGRCRMTGTVYVLDSWAKKVPVHEALQVAFQKIKYYRPKIFGVESVQAQYDMYRQLNEMCVKNGVYHTRLKPVIPKGRKEDRIEILEPLFENGTIKVKRSQRLLIEMLEQFPNHDHDDLPDCLASCLELAGKQRKRSYWNKPEGF